MTKSIQAAKPGWYSLDFDNPELYGSCCQSCGTYYFPIENTFCRNPSCQGEAFDQVALSTEGKVWSYTAAAYPPPPPFILTTDKENYVPVCQVAVQLEKEQLIILGQLADGYNLDDMVIGDSVQLVLDILYSDDEHDYVVWKWQPLTKAGSKGDANE